MGSRIRDKSILSGRGGQRVATGGEASTDSPIDASDVDKQRVVSDLSVSMFILDVYHCNTLVSLLSVCLYVRRKRLSFEFGVVV